MHSNPRTLTEDIKPALIPVEARVGEALGLGAYGETEYTLADVLCLHPGVCSETKCVLADVLCLCNDDGLTGNGCLHGRLSGETLLSSWKSGILASSTLSFTGVLHLTEARTSHLTEACTSRLTKACTSRLTKASNLHLTEAHTVLTRAEH
jgi:hypothetical protein